MKRFTVIAVPGMSQTSCQTVSGQLGGGISSLVNISGLNSSVPKMLPMNVMTKPIHHCLRLMRPWNVVSSCTMSVMPAVRSLPVERDRSD